MAINKEYFHVGEQLDLFPVEEKYSLEEAKTTLKMAELYRLKDSWSGSCELDWTRGGVEVAVGFWGEHSFVSLGAGMGRCASTFTRRDDVEVLMECYSKKSGGWN